FVDVGARGNLAGFVDDILRGKPAFAIAANLPRRGGLTQLNHLVAATFAQGAPVEPEFLYARRQPRPIDWDAPESSPRATVEWKIGYPETRLSEALVARFRSRQESDFIGPAVPTGSAKDATSVPAGMAGPADPRANSSSTVARNGAAHYEDAPTP